MLATTPLGYKNNTGNFYPSGPGWVGAYLPFKASVAITAGSAIRPETNGADVTGYYTLALTENAGGDDILGIIQETIATTDADYATAGKLKQVRLFTTPMAECFFKVKAGVTFDITQVGSTVELFEGNTLDTGTLGKGARITQFISSSEGKCCFCMPMTETA